MSAHLFTELERTAVYQAIPARRDMRHFVPGALLCLGPVAEFYPRPMLEQLNWRQGKPLVVMQDKWVEAC